jgi:hypothetical protein
MDSIIEETEHKAEGMSNITKLGVLAGTLGLTGLLAYSLRDGGYLTKKMAKGPAWSGVDSVHLQAGWGQHEEGSEGVENATDSDWSNWYHASGPGPGRIYLAGGGETASSLAAKYNASGHEADIIAANPNLSWPVSNGDHVVIPDLWAPLYAAKGA